MTLRVLHVTASASLSGGGEKHAADLVRGLRERGVDCALASPEGELPQALAPLGVEWFRAPINSGYGSEKVARVRSAIDWEPDVVHAHGSRAAFFARLADPRGRERLVYTLHGIHVAQSGSWFRRRALLFAERSLRKRTARFITVCESDAEKGARLGILSAEKTRTVHNGVPLPVTPGVAGAFRKELGIGPDRPLVLHVGRLHQQKDQATLLRAWREVQLHSAAAMLAIVGSGPLAVELQELASALGVSCAVTFLEPRESLADAYTDADAFALSSRWEGLPYVVLEAMAYGLPVVSTTVDGVPEAVDDGVTGRLVRPGDPEALSHAIVATLEDPARARAMAQAARARVDQEFTVDLMVERTLAVYKELASAASRASTGGAAL